MECTASVPDEADPNVTCCIYSLWYDKELRELMTERMEEFCYLGWSSHIHTNRAEQNFAVSNSYVSPAAEIGVGSYLEDSMFVINHR